MMLNSTHAKIEEATLLPVLGAHLVGAAAKSKVERTFSWLRLELPKQRAIKPLNGSREFKT